VIGALVGLVLMAVVVLGAVAAGTLA